MKKNLTLLLTAVLCSASSAFSNTNHPDDYTPLVQEGKTWWYTLCVDYEDIPYADKSLPPRVDIGFTIGGKEELDGQEYNRVYTKYFNFNIPSEPFWFKHQDGEDEGVVALIREENRKVYIGWAFAPHNKIGIGCTYLSWDEALVYDFSEDASSYVLGNTYTGFTFNLKGREDVEQNGKTFRRFTYNSDDKDINMIDGENTDYHFIEGVGIVNDYESYFPHFFYMPFASFYIGGYSYISERPILTYVTDADNNILYVGAGGPKIWEDMDGVDEVSVDNTASGPAQWFDLYGRRIAEPPEGGIYLLRRGNNVTKVLR